MAQPIVLEKILNIREQEKSEAQIEKNKATDYFEKVAKNLYYALKKKEQAEDGLYKYMKGKATITKIKEQSLYIDALNKKILTLQEQVQLARTQMEASQVKLTDAHVEVKKVEKLIEKRKSDQLELEQKLEKIEMDEISIRQFMNQNR